MMTDGPTGTPLPPADEEDAALWRLLERAPRPGPVSPYFARRVLREVAALEENAPSAAGKNAPGWLARLWWSWQGQARGVFAGALAAAALLAVGLKVAPSRPSAAPAMPSHTGTVAAANSAGPAQTAGPETASDDGAAPPSVTAASEPPVAAQDVEVIADLDNLLSREESRLWTDEDNTTARF